MQTNNMSWPFQHYHDLTPYYKNYFKKEPLKRFDYLWALIKQNTEAGNGKMIIENLSEEDAKEFRRLNFNCEFIDKINAWLISWYNEN